MNTYWRELKATPFSVQVATSRVALQIRNLLNPIHLATVTDPCHGSPTIGLKWLRCRLLQGARPWQVGSLEGGAFWDLLRDWRNCVKGAVLTCVTHQLDENSSMDQNDGRSLDPFGDGSKPWYLVNPKIAGKWMFIPLKMVLIGIDPYPLNSWKRPILWDAGYQTSNHCWGIGPRHACESQMRLWKCRRG